MFVTNVNSNIVSVSSVRVKLKKSIVKVKKIFISLVSTLRNFPIAVADYQCVIVLLFFFVICSARVFFLLFVNPFLFCVLPTIVTGFVLFLYRVPAGDKQTIHILVVV